jgi:hypothetical protein
MLKLNAWSRMIWEETSGIEGGTLRGLVKASLLTHYIALQPDQHSLTAHNLHPRNTTYNINGLGILPHTLNFLS